MRLSLVLLAAIAATAAAQKKETPKIIGEKDIAYGTHERHKLDIDQPPGDGPFPLVLWVHGGAWEGGSKEGGARTFLVPAGYAVASMNYRLSKHAPYPAQIHDVKAAVRFLRANAKKYKIDPDRIGACGASAGGHLVALLGTANDEKDLEGDLGNPGVSSRVRCVLDFFGPTDLTKLSPPKAKANPVTRLIGGDLGDKKALAEQADPIRYATKDDAPFLIVHGDKDNVVPLNQSELLNDALKKAGVEVTLTVVKDAGHGNGIFTAPLMKEYVAFLDKHLKK